LGHAGSQCLRHYAASRKVMGSIPEEVIGLSVDLILRIGSHYNQGCMYCITEIVFAKIKHFHFLMCDSFNQFWCFSPAILLTKDEFVYVKNFHYVF
jgi:hypothetical protein